MSSYQNKLLLFFVATSWICIGMGTELCAKFVPILAYTVLPVLFKNMNFCAFVLHLRHVSCLYSIQFYCTFLTIILPFQRCGQVYMRLGKDTRVGGASAKMLKVEQTKMWLGFTAEDAKSVT